MNSRQDRQDSALEKYMPFSLSFEGAGPDFVGTGFKQQIHSGSNHQQWEPTNDLARVRMDEKDNL